MMSADTDKTRAFQFIVSTLPGCPDIRVLRAASRAGATAILNLEAVRDAEAALAAFVRARAGRIGVRVDSPAVFELVRRSLSDALDVLVLTPDALSATVDAVASLRSPGRSILLECTTLEDARLGVALNVDGIIAKGHESGGRVAEETTFVLVQRLAAELPLPIFAHGGIGLHTAAACYVAGCAGAVLDAQLLLARESSAAGAVRATVERLVGDETICIGGDLGAPYRVYRRPGLQALQELQRIEDELSRDTVPPDERTRRWQDAVEARVNWSNLGAPLWPLGQDAAFAADLAKRFRSVAGILEGLRRSVWQNVEAARSRTPLAPGAPLAQSHGTAYPILQGPMTRVSDTAEFAASVAEGGGLPFLALALLRGPQVRSLLQDTKRLLADRPWGVGMLGFVPLELREEQLAVIEEFRPPFALIAGGRPDQAVRLERLGIPTYLHVPTPALLKMFLDDGARRFIFEGRECGGHVGPRTSFVLWELAVHTLLAAIARGVPAADLHVVFAGGIHDARSAAMVSAIAAPLAEAGIRVGALIGTAYLFTEEAVSAGAIVGTFQEEALACTQTVLLETGPGHATRCADTPFCDAFQQARRDLLADGKSPDDVRATLEMLNLGRLRIASKGIRREAEPAGGAEGPAYVTLDGDEQRQFGMYMIGQVAALRRSVCTVSDLHDDVSAGSTAILAAVESAAAPESQRTVPASLSAEVAIVGMGCLLPNALDVRALWSNVLGKRDAIREVPRERFDPDLYYDPDRRARDRIYSKWGGFLEEVPFDPLKYGIPPSAVPSIDPFQLLTLAVVDQALNDAGYGERPFNRERTSVILGASGGVGDLGFRYGIRAGLPMYIGQPSEDVLSRLPEWTEDSFAGVLLNVAAGRVANRFNLGGLNFTVDAACASSLAAIYLATRELESGSSDVVLVGGIDTVNSPFGYLCFSSAQALSPRGRCRTFDENADGIAISEGLAVVVLKRLSDAERDGDRIYAVIRGVAGSSDGRGKGLTAPRPEGQVRVLERAYEAAGISPSTVGLIEAHGTGTVAGDGAEVAALTRVFAAAGAAPRTCALGSIKSMIGHTKSAAGVTGLLKVALSLHHKVLPPTLHVSTPNARLRESGNPFYVNSEARPWIAPAVDQPRRAGVSSFGFGGTNFHVVVEEYDPETAGMYSESAANDEWPAELAVWSAASPAELAAALEQVERAIAQEPQPPLRVVAAAVSRTYAPRRSAGGVRLAIVADTLDDFRRKIAAAKQAAHAGHTAAGALDGVYLAPLPEPGARPVAFLFPGQGSQYPGMHRELSIHFPELRHALETGDRITSGLFERRLSSYVLPPPVFTKADEDAAMRELTDTAVAQPALGVVESGLARLFERLGVRPRFTAGHSYGEYVALAVAGAFSTETLLTLSAARGDSMKRACGEGAGAMAAVGAAPDAVAFALGSDPHVWIANFNSPRQTVIAGTTEAVDRAIGALTARGVSARRVPVSCAFHSPLVTPAQEEMAAVLARSAIRRPRVTVFSNTLGAPYPDDPEAIRGVLSQHMVRPVRFVEEIQAMHAAGARVFVELGPRSVLTNLARETLSGSDALFLALNAPDKPELPQLLHTLAQLAVAGVDLDLDVLAHGRSIPLVRVGDLAEAAGPVPPAHAWMVSGGRARPPVSLKARESAPRPPAATPASSAPPATAPAPPAAKPSTPAPPAAVTAPKAPVPTGGARSAPAKKTNVRQTNLFTGGAMYPNSLPDNDQHSADHAPVMRQFQQLMSQFLQTQALVMTAYLQGVPRDGAAAGLPPMAALPAAPRAMPAPPRPAAMEAPAVAMPLAAAAVVERIAPPAVAAAPPVVAAAAVVAPPAPVAPAPPAVAPVAVGATVPVAAKPSAAPAPTEADVLARLLRIVAERTGYPEEMLAIDANIESDLGIDSIKRMEILAAFQETSGGTERGAFQAALERLTALKTLRESAAALAELLGAESSAAAVA